MSHFMEEEGYDFVSADDGASGLIMAVQQSPDLILLDMEMPNMDGLEVCRRLKSDDRTQSIPIIFLTGRDTSTERVAAQKLGAADYLTKPFHPTKLSLEAERSCN